MQTMSCYLWAESPRRGVQHRLAGVDPSARAQPNFLQHRVEAGLGTPRFSHILAPLWPGTNSQTSATKNLLPILHCLPLIPSLTWVNVTFSENMSTIIPRGYKQHSLHLDFRLLNNFWWHAALPTGWRAVCPCNCCFLLGGNPQH